MILSPSPSLSTAYVWLGAEPSQVSEAVLLHGPASKPWTVRDTSYPFEFSVPVPEELREFTFQVEVTRADGSKEKTQPVTLKHD